MREFKAITHRRFGQLIFQKRVSDLRSARARTAKKKMAPPKHPRALADKIWWKRAMAGYKANGSRRGRIGQRLALKRVSP